MGIECDMQMIHLKSNTTAKPLLFQEPKEQLRAASNEPCISQCHKSPICGLVNLGGVRLGIRKVDGENIFIYISSATSFHIKVHSRRQL